MKKILILGGTMFIGRSFTERLIASETYDVTLFNRGKSNTGIFDGVKQITGDRETADIEKIFSQYWDCIIDFSGYYPQSFEKLLNGLSEKVGRYIFISTVSVFGLNKLAGQFVNEQFPILECSEEQKLSPLPAAYGEKKAEMERLLLKHAEFDKIIFRPGFAYGKYDSTERFYYWLYRVQKCQQFLLPDENRPRTLSLTNVDDLTEAILQAIEIEKHSTIYNSISTPAISIRDLLGIAAEAYGKNPEMIVTDSQRLSDLSIQLSQFPLLLPFDFSVDDELWKRDFPFERKGIATTLLDMRNYKAEAGYPSPKAGLALEKEQQVIEKLFV